MEFRSRSRLKDVLNGKGEVRGEKGEVEEREGEEKEEEDGDSGRC